MSKAKAKIWARLIHKRLRTLEDAALEHRDAIIEAYVELYSKWSA